MMALSNAREVHANTHLLIARWHMFFNTSSSSLLVDVACTTLRSTRFFHASHMIIAIAMMMSWLHSIALEMSQL